MKSLAVLNECMFTKSQKKYLKTTFENAVFYTDTTSEVQAIRRVGSRNIIIMDQFLFTFSEKLLKACPFLELVIVNTTAYDAIDISLLNKFGVKLAHVQDYATQDVAEVALSMICSLNVSQETAQNIVSGRATGLLKNASKELVNDIWPGHPITRYIERKQLKNQIVGIIGLGSIGKRCAELCLALGMRVIAFNRSRKYVEGVDTVSLRRLWKESDIHVITLAYEKGEMDNFITGDLLSLAKNDSLLISVSHPNLIDMTYLIQNPHKFQGIGFDYLVTDSVRQLMKVRKHNIIITPHLGSQSHEARENMTENLIEAAMSFASGNGLYIVN